VRLSSGTHRLLIQGADIYLGDARCSFKSGTFVFKRGCGEPATALCVYCNEPFCDAHGTHGEEYYEICARDRCQAKYRDLGDHADWVRKHHHDNLAGYCAADECEEALDIPCERCGLRFCQPHVRSMSVRVVELLGGETMRTQLLCPHCVARRKIWD